MKIPIYQVDAFTNERFKGNPAAVCPLDSWLPDAVMQNIAAENNLAETAFVVAEGNEYEIRWFTPTVEVDLCGHATLASAYVLFNELNFPSLNIRLKLNVQIKQILQLVEVCVFPRHRSEFVFSS